MTTIARPSLADHLTGVLAGIEPLPPLLLALLDARGGVLAQDVVAATPLPPYDTAAADGYAVRSADVAVATGAAPVRLSVLGDLLASSWQPSGISPGTCYAVAAGAPLPSGADAVVPASWTDAGAAATSVHRAPPAGLNVRRTGCELPAGGVLAAGGAVVTPGLIGLLACAGIDHLLVRPRPRVAVFSTGNELVEVGATAGPGQVVDVNSYALCAAAGDAGAHPIRVGIVPNDPEPLHDRLEDHAMRADLLVLSGGTGEGSDDTVRRLGWDGSVEFVELPLHPATVIGFGRVGTERTPVLCLPGDPAAALIAFELIARPIVQRLAGAEPVFRPSVKANLLAPVTSPGGLREFRPARVTERRGGGYTAQPLSTGDRLLSGLASANGLVVLGESVTSAPVGTTVDVLLLDRVR